MVVYSPFGGDMGGLEPEQHLVPAFNVAICTGHVFSSSLLSIELKCLITPMQQPKLRYSQQQVIHHKIRAVQILGYGKTPVTCRQIEMHGLGITSVHDDPAQCTSYVQSQSRQSQSVLTQMTHTYIHKTCFGIAQPPTSLVALRPPRPSSRAGLSSTFQVLVPQSMRHTANLRSLHQVQHEAKLGAALET